MARRTIAEARRLLADAAPSLNPEMYRRIDDEIKVVEADARTLATEYANQRADDLTNLRNDVLVEVCEVRDGYDALMAEAELGLIDADDYHHRFQQLEDRKRYLGTRAGELDYLADAVERIDEDPVAWTDRQLFGKYPQITPEFSF